MTLIYMHVKSSFNLIYTSRMDRRSGQEAEDENWQHYWICGQ